MAGPDKSQGNGAGNGAASSTKIKVAIIGSGNIGTDLMIKVMRTSDVLEVGALVGIAPQSDGLARAQRLGVATTHDGIEGLRRLPVWNEIGIVFDATSAAAHQRNNQICVEDGKVMIDLTPAAVGPYVIPVVNGEANLDAPNVNMVTCGGQATIPIVAAVSQVAQVHYAEIVSSISSRSAGPGTRANIDEFTETTARGIERVGGAVRGKAITILNPAEPPVMLRGTAFSVSSGRHGGEGAGLCARLPPQAGGAVRALRLQQQGEHTRDRRIRGHQDLDLPGGGRRGALPAVLCRQSRHHDIGGAGHGRKGRRAQAPEESGIRPGHR